MNLISAQSSPPQVVRTIVIYVLLVVFVITTCSQQEEQSRFTECQKKFNCGRIQGVGYPFWGGNRSRSCGRDGFELFCTRTDEDSILEITLKQFRLLGINQSNFTVRIGRYGPWGNEVCNDPAFFNMTLNSSSPFKYPDTVHAVSIFYGCTLAITTQVKHSFTCPRADDRSPRFTTFYADITVQEASQCANRIKVPILQTAYQELWGGNLTLLEALHQGFEIQYEKDSCSACEASGGVCGSKIGSYLDDDDSFLCLCHHGSDPIACHGPKRKIWLAVIIGASAVGVGVLVIGLIVCWSQRQFFSNKSALQWRNKPTNDRSLEDIIKHHGPLAPKRYSYSDVKKMTKSFKYKLGQGGYGSVYKGNLQDGHLVAVKILNVSKGNGEDFINEVTSISRTSHVNVVTLKGYCLQGSKRALVYDFMPNGSLEKFICNETSSKAGSTRLDWETLYRITVQIARGLEYLHSGCNTRILHFDIKPHNILLDKDFCPKISDFGLAKLCTGKESIVSMVGARGTVGYIAPEVFCRNFGGVSYKSDVYSYGMMVLEMVGARKKMVGEDIDDGSSECYFPQWIYKSLEAGGDLELQADMTEEENEITKKMTVVGLWCIQTDPSQRPSMGRVLEMLEGSIQHLEFPPKPFLTSPPRPPPEYSTTLTLSKIASC